MIKLKSILTENYYHITKRSNLKNIKKFGILPSIPDDMPLESKAVYLFRSKEDAEDALVNWMGDRFNDEEELILLTIDPTNIKSHPSNVNYEIKSFETIPFSSVTKVEKI